ncbi:MAG: HD domain-containing protein [Flavobacteriia bacterium]|nr:HD domain-containing protein [Flavobacteriia bacterium]
MVTIENKSNKKKLFNDPVYGFITIPNEFIYDIIEHPYFQRLRRICQLGLTHLVYPGALHTRFHHALGSMHLMTHAVSILKKKGAIISEDEENAVLLAILLHDIGHGPFSHALEYDLVNHVSHEKISEYFIQALSKEHQNKLDLCLQIFRNEYHQKPFLYQLVSSQLDMDRLDYLNRDSFYTGVTEGQIGAERIIEMLNVVDGQLVLEEKAIYSVEKFLVTRRFMYWQVYLHKTVVSAEFMLIHILRRAKELVQQGKILFASPALNYFLSKQICEKDFENNSKTLVEFSKLDDYDITCSIKVWQEHEDKILSLLSQKLIKRDLFKIIVSKEEFDTSFVNQIKDKVKKLFDLNDEEVNYFVYSEKLVNNAYNQNKQNINLLFKNKEIKDVSLASDNYNLNPISSPVEKYCLCYPSFNE